MLTSQLVFGTATLFREPKARVRRRVLEAALVGGVSEFDTAPIYGLGKAEPELAEFLQFSANPGDITVSTKFGRAAPGANPMFRVLQPMLRSAVRRLPSVRSVARSSTFARSHPVNPAQRDLAQAIETSHLLFGTMLRRVVAHDPPASDVWYAAIANLQVKFPIFDLGVSCEPTDCETWLGHLAQDRPTTINVDAYSALRLEKVLANHPGTTYIHSSIRIAEELAWESSGPDTCLPRRELRDLDVLASQSRRIAFGLACIMSVHPGAKVIIGSSNRAHVSDLLAAVADLAAFSDSAGPIWARQLASFTHDAGQRIVAARG